MLNGVNTKDLFKPSPFDAALYQIQLGLNEEEPKEEPEPVKTDLAQNKRIRHDPFEMVLAAQKKSVRKAGSKKHSHKGNAKKLTARILRLGRKVW